MAVTIGSNVASLQAQRRLSASSEALSSTYAKLSSGQRIVKASDDAAGLAVADSLRAQTRMAAVAVRNANDGVSFISIADGALNEIGNILARMSELAAQSANGTFSDTQRTAINTESTQLIAEIDRITNTTSFNSVGIINSAGTAAVLQVGLDATASSQITLSKVNATAAGLAVNAVSLATSTGAQTAITSINTAISSLAANRGSIGAVESRLRITVSNLNVARENFAAAESRIRDVDVASESAELTRLTILQQAGAAVLAQANQAPALALQLLS
jgi:flagellin